MALFAVAAVAEEMPVRGGTLVYAVGAEPDSYDCHGAASFAAIHVLAPHYSLLLKIDPQNFPQPVPDTAAGYEVSPDRLTYTFKLRPNVKFHNGSPLTSEDVKATYERLRNPPPKVLSVRKGAYEDIASIETPDPLTVIFKLSKPNSSMLTTFALPWNCLYSAAKLKEDPTWPQRNIMGTGPFRFVDHIAGAEWRGERFAEYFEPGKPYLDGFRAVFISGPAMVNALQGGSVEAEFRGVSPGDRNRLVDALGKNIVIEESPWVCGTNLFFNVTKKPFDDARVRRALSLAIDRWKGAESLSKVAIVKGVGATLRPGYRLAASDEELVRLPGFGRDIKAAREEAKRLLKEAGAEGLSFKLLNRNVPMPYLPVGIYVIDQWRRIGVTAEHVPTDVKTQKAAMNANNFDVGMDGVCEDLDDPNIQLLGYISTDRSSRSRGGFVDRTLDDLYDRQKDAHDEAERRSILREFDRRALTEANTVPVFWWHRIVAHSAKLKGWQVTPSTYVNQDLAGVWLAP